MESPPVVALDLAVLAARARSLCAGRQRAIVGLTGAPGVGKSTVAAQLAALIGDECAVVPLDGYHLASSVIAGTELRDRRGAPDTFDPVGFVALLRRLRDDPDATHYAPAYSRAIEDPIAGSIAVGPNQRVVIVEGNYLLWDEPAWAPIRPLLDEAWFLESARDLRLPRLVARHVAAGKHAQAAVEWANGPDEANARLIASTREGADLVIRETSDPEG